MDNPRVFISYSWSNPEHEEWVLQLATALRESGVDAILDKWGLKEGHDAVAFMEQMVTDPTVEKVIIVSDQEYANKADGRAGGVGTETQIVTSEIYDKRDQDKYVVVLSEKDESGRPYLPTYYRSRIYIDLSETDCYAANFESLLRWIFGKPLSIKPDLGTRPGFLDGEVGLSLSTSVAHKRVISAIKAGRAHADGALDEYLKLFSVNLEKFRLDPAKGEFDDEVVKNIEQFLPYRNELIQLIFAIARYSPSVNNASKLHRFFESLISYMDRPKGARSWGEWDFDNFKFIVHELFLYAIAILIALERFELVNELVSRHYYVEGNSDYGRDAVVDYAVFWQPTSSLVHRNDRLKLRRFSLRSEMLKERSSASGLELRQLMQADFILFMRMAMEKHIYSSRWWPSTLLFAGDGGPLEIFARSISRKCFDNVKCLLNIDEPSDLDPVLENFQSDPRRLPSWKFQSFSPRNLLGYEQLAKLP